VNLLILIVIGGILYILLVVPRRRRQREHIAMQDSIDVGDEVITAGGLHGQIHSIGDGTVELEIAEGVVVTLDRRAVAAVAHDEEVEVEPDEEPPAAETVEKPS
jgi:preprotein translocase subunit YajC